MGRLNDDVDDEDEDEDQDEDEDEDEDEDDISGYCVFYFDCRF